MIKIEKNVSLPKARTVSRGKNYGLDALEVGDSFRIASPETQQMRQAVKTWKYRHPGWDYLIDYDDEGILRCWRTA